MNKTEETTFSNASSQDEYYSTDIYKQHSNLEIDGSNIAMLIIVSSIILFAIFGLLLIDKMGTGNEFYSDTLYLSSSQQKYYDDKENKFDLYNYIKDMGYNVNYSDDNKIYIDVNGWGIFTDTNGLPDYYADSGWRIFANTSDLPNDYADSMPYVCIGKPRYVNDKEIVEVSKLYIQEDCNEEPRTNEIFICPKQELKGCIQDKKLTHHRLEWILKVIPILQKTPYNNDINPFKGTDIPYKEFK